MRFSEDSAFDILSFCGKFYTDNFNSQLFKCGLFMKKLPERTEIPVELTWDLSKMYKNDSDFEADFTKLAPMCAELEKLQGHLLDSPQTLLKGIELSDDLNRLGEKLYTFAHLRSDEDTSNNPNRARMDRISGAFAKISGALAFFEPEILAGDEKLIRKWLEDEPLAFYKRSMEELLRAKPHTLSTAEERLLGLYSDVLGGTDDVFSIMNDSDIEFDEISDGKGSKVRLSHGNYYSFLINPDRKVRRNAFKAMLSAYKKFRNTFGATLSGTVKRHVVSSQVRHYDSALEAALFDDNIKVDVYKNLIKAVHSKVPYLTRYIKLRKKLLKLKKIDMYDLYNPLLPDVQLKYTFDEAKELVLKALAPLGSEYIETLKTAFDSRWIDVMENKGKRSGAYSSGCYDSVPYLLLNFNGTLNDVFTLAHELGHSMHSYYSNKTQHYHYADYSIFVAEVASTTNELLLAEYLLANTDNVKLRAYLLGHLADEIRATIYRQTMFAEFELKIHELAEKDEALSADVLSDVYFKIHQKYYGEAIPEPDELIAMEWARIPHFYYNFYVYKYASGMSAAIKLKDNILSGDPEKIEAYFSFLKAGDSLDVLDIMRNAGVDLSTPQPIADALDTFGRVVAELENAVRS